jgi:hypothetical protein
MPGDVVPAEAEVVATGRIDAALQQRGNGFWTGEIAGGWFFSRRESAKHLNEASFFGSCGIISAFLRRHLL